MSIHSTLLISFSFILVVTSCFREFRSLLPFLLPGGHHSKILLGSLSSFFLRTNISFSFPHIHPNLELVVHPLSRIGFRPKRKDALSFIHSFTFRKDQWHLEALVYSGSILLSPVLCWLLSAFRMLDRDLPFSENQTRKHFSYIFSAFRGQNPRMEVNCKNQFFLSIAHLLVFSLILSFTSDFCIVSCSHFEASHVIQWLYN